MSCIGFDTLHIGGQYRHFKGDIYTVIGVANDVDDMSSPLVIYIDAGGILWARRFADFMGEVDRERYPDAAQDTRFKYIGERVEEV
ncbi:DUF1653 domain-containing protein [Faecalibaculum rodentium]|uniref:DUF1653 domain-containing protein n=1 Tax=Faecalibaculum rodentium TaxID=1702221 RepID=UPI0027316F92|nr:DUF1653 domain-containing protein [Faecalibaculum rodentium]